MVLVDVQVLVVLVELVDVLNEEVVEDMVVV